MGPAGPGFMLDDGLDTTHGHMEQGRGHAVPEDEELLLHWHISEPNLTSDEIDRLVDFMKTLSDESLIPTTPAQLPSGLPFKHMENIHEKS